MRVNIKQTPLQLNQQAATQAAIDLLIDNCAQKMQQNADLRAQKLRHDAVCDKLKLPQLRSSSQLVKTKPVLAEYRQSVVNSTDYLKKPDEAYYIAGMAEKQFRQMELQRSKRFRSSSVAVGHTIAP